MKKILTLVAIMMMALSTQAQKQYGLGIDQYPWNYSFAPTGSTSKVISFTDKYGEYGIINAGNAISPSDYKGIRIEYQAFPETAVDGSYVHVKINDKQYIGFPTDGTEIVAEFNEDVMALETIDALNIQGAVAGPKIVIKKVFLVKTDGTEEEVIAAAGGGWGCSATQVAMSGTITFTGQYGAMAVVDENGDKVVFNPGDKAKNYVIKLAEPAPVQFMVELDGAGGGFKWLNYPAGTTKVEVEVSDASCTQPMTAMYIKADAADKALYPFDLKIESITVAGEEGGEGGEEEEGEDLALYVPGSIWNATFCPTAGEITFNDLWAEYAAINADNAISPAEYKGIRVEYEPDASTAVDDNGWLRYVQVKIGSGDNTQYVGMSPNATFAEGYFNDAVMALEQIENINLQGVTSGAKVKIKAFYLIKSDDSLEQIALAGPVWGCSFGNVVPSGKITYTGRYGALKIVDAEGNDIAFEPGTGAQGYKYVIELASEAGGDFMVEADDADDKGFVWNNFTAGSTKYEFEITDENCGSWADDVFTPKALANLYIKSTAEDGYPYDIVVKRIYRVPVGSAVVKTVGDANGDGEVNVSDVMLTVNYVLWTAAEGFVFDNADINADGEVNVTDVMGIVSIVLGN